jgi:hypothetical protein
LLVVKNMIHHACWLHIYYGMHTHERERVLYVRMMHAGYAYAYIHTIKRERVRESKEREGEGGGDGGGDGRREGGRKEGREGGTCCN